MRRYPYTDPAGTAKLNVVATTGPGKAAELALVCHTDTVPFDLAWKDAVTPVVRRGRLYGRGSADVKGCLACILAAISQIDVRRLAKPLALVLTADEEIGCVGAKYLARKKAIRARFAIVGEPTVSSRCARERVTLSRKSSFGEKKRTARFRRPADPPFQMRRAWSWRWNGLPGS